MFSFFKPKPAETPPESDDPAAPESPPATAAPAASGTGQDMAAPSPPAAEPAPKRSWAERLKAGLARTRAQLGRPVGELFHAQVEISESLYEELETILLTADAGIEATAAVLQELRARAAEGGLRHAGELNGVLKTILVELLAPIEAPLAITAARPFVIMMVGVNGAGKTTTIGKLAKYYQAQGHSVLLAAGDTFRAAAREQLAVWGARNDVAVIAQDQGDSAAVIFDAVHAARARGVDVVLADTAGRLPTQLHLMEELRKVKRVIQKADPGAPHEVLLVLDANTGQNGLTQVQAFDEALGLTGLVVTKLDGTAKGGVLAAIAKRRPVPVRFIGVGESLDDLRPFRAREFVDAMFD